VNAPGARAARPRLLIVSLEGMGWHPISQELLAYARRRDDLEVEHAFVPLGFVARAVSARRLRGRGRLPAPVRRLAAVRVALRRHLSGALDPGRFDVVYAAPFEAGHAVWRFREGRRPALAVRIDTTVRQALGELWGVPEARVEAEQRWLMDQERELLGSVELLVAASEWVAASVRRQALVPSDRVWVAPTATTPPKRRTVPVPDGERPLRIVFVGNHWERKGGPRLVAWHQQHWAERAELHICSAGGQVPRRARGVVDHGSVPRERLLEELLPSMDVFVLPTFRDMSPVSVVEAASVGLPVVSSRIAAIPELVVDGETGFLLPPQDDEGFVAAVDRLLDDHALRARMGEAGRQLTQQHGPDTVYPQLLDRIVALAAPVSDSPAPRPGGRVDR